MFSPGRQQEILGRFIQAVPIVQCSYKILKDHNLSRCSRKTTTHSQNRGSHWLPHLRFDLVARAHRHPQKRGLTKTSLQKKKPRLNCQGFLCFN